MRLIAVLVVAVILGGCGLFGEARCSDERDCPDDVPFCVEGVCTDEADDPDEPPSGCSIDADCGRDLCYDIDDASGLAGSCVPAGLVDDCATARVEATRSRDDGGPALVSLALGPPLGGCTPSYSLTFRYFDREGDMPDPNGFVPVLFLRVAAEGFASASALVGSTVDGDDPARAALVEFEVCDDAALEPVAAWLEDSGGHRSNVVCAAP